MGPWGAHLICKSTLAAGRLTLGPRGAHFVYEPTSPQSGFGRWAFEAPTLLRNPPSPPSGAKLDAHPAALPQRRRQGTVLVTSPPRRKTASGDGPLRRPP